MTNSIAQILAKAVQAFADHSDSPRLDAEVLLAFVLQKNRSYLHAWPEKILTAEQLYAFTNLQMRRCEGIPIAYLVGQKEFWSLPLIVSSHTLIPRPATETLVELALQLFAQQQHLRVLDLGTGTGAIALALATQKPDWEIIAVDISTDAIAIAKQNAEHLSCKNVQFLVSNWYSALSQQHFDLIVSNPPYIAKHDPHLAQGDVRFEPKLALVADEDGFACLRIIATHAKSFLTKHGCLMLEHGYDQAKKTRELLHEMQFTNIKTFYDHEQHERITIACC